MISVTDTTRVRADPTDVWRFFASMHAHYRQWHPDHVAWYDSTGDVTHAGSVIYASERLGPLYFKHRFSIDAVEPGRSFSYRLGFPLSLLRTGGRVRLEPTGDGHACELHSEIHLGYRAPVIGPLVDWLIRKLLPVEELRTHMAEEGRNLDRLLAHRRPDLAAAEAV